MSVVLARIGPMTLSFAGTEQQMQVQGRPSIVFLPLLLVFGYVYDIAVETRFFQVSRNLPEIVLADSGPLLSAGIL
jgi:hypothetical protein